MKKQIFFCWPIVVAIVLAVLIYLEDQEYFHPYYWMDDFRILSKVNFAANVVIFLAIPFAYYLRRRFISAKLINLLGRIREDIISLRWPIQSSMELISVRKRFEHYLRTDILDLENLLSEYSLLVGNEVENEYRSTLKVEIDTLKSAFWEYEKYLFQNECSGEEGNEYLILKIERMKKKVYGIDDDVQKEFERLISNLENKIQD